MPEKHLAELLDELEHAEGASLQDPETVAKVADALRTEHVLLDKERKLNADARRKLLRIVYAMVVAVLALGIVSVVQQFKNGDLTDDNADAIAQIQANRVQLTYDTCKRQNNRMGQALEALRNSQSNPAAAAFTKALANAIGITEDQLRAFTESNQKATTALVAKIVLDDPVMQTPAGPRRDCEQAIVDRFGDTALLADLDRTARARVVAMLKN